MFILYLGYAIYFFYGIRNSALREKEIVTEKVNGKTENEKQVITKF